MDSLTLELSLISSPSVLTVVFYLVFVSSGCNLCAFVHCLRKDDVFFVSRTS